MMILFLIAASGLCILLSLIRPNKKKINLIAVSLSAIIIPGIVYQILIKQDSTSLGQILAIVASAVGFVLSFIVSLATSFAWQLGLLRKRNRDTDEMNRQLWLCDKLLIRLQAEGRDQKAALQDCVKNMIVFLSLREKLFGIESGGEQNILASYLNQNDAENIRAKLKEYKTWITRELFE